MKRLSLTMLLTVCSAILSMSQTSPVTPDIRLRVLAVNRGLSNNHVLGITQDKNGFIWIATDEGLNRFDGYSFKTYYKEENASGSGLTGNELNWVMDDPKRPVIWIATQRAGLDVYNYKDDTFSAYRHEDGNPKSLITDDVTSIAAAADGGIWITTYWKGIDHLDPETGEFTHYNSNTVKGMPDASVLRAVDSGDGFLYAVHEHNGFTIIDIAHRTARNFMPQPGVPNTIPTADLQCVYIDSMNNIWIGGSGGLILFNRDDNSFTDLSEWYPELQFAILIDSQDNFWSGWDYGGLDMYDSRHNFKSYTRNDGLPGDIVQTAWEAPDGKLWFGLFHAGAAIYDPMTKTFKSVFPAGSREDIRDFAGLSDGSVAIASSRGIWIWRPDSPGPEGPILAGNGLIRKIYPISKNRILLGTFGAGLIITDEKFNPVRYLMVTDGFPSNTVNDIFRGRNGNIWVATGEGLVMFPDILGAPDKYTVINKASGMDNSHVQAIAQDRSGNIWVSTNGGISCIKGDEVLNYSHRDHVPLGNFLSHSVDIDKQGNLYFGSISGLCAFNPIKILEKTPAPSVILEEVSVLEHSGNTSGNRKIFQVTGKEKLSLRPGQNSFEISFTTGNFANADEVEYAYMLDGIDDDWTILENGNVAMFRDLPSGTFTFMIKARLRNHEWGEVSEIKMILPPPFWLSWWAVTIYIRH